MNTVKRIKGVSMLAVFTLGLMLSLAGDARANTGKVGYVYSVTLAWQQIDPATRQVKQRGTYARYFVTVYSDNSVDYGGADKGWYNILRYQNCQPYIATYTFVRTTNNG